MTRKSVKLLLMTLVASAYSAQIFATAAPAVAAAAQVLTKVAPAVAPVATPALSLSQSLGKLILTYPKTTIAAALIVACAFAPEKKSKQSDSLDIPITDELDKTHEQVVTDGWKKLLDESGLKETGEKEIVRWRVKVYAPADLKCPRVEITKYKNASYYLEFDEKEKCASLLYSQLNAYDDLVRIKFTITIEETEDSLTKRKYWIYTFTKRVTNFTHQAFMLLPYERGIKSGDNAWGFTQNPWNDFINPAPQPVQ